MWELDCEEGWASKNWCFWSVVLEKTLESPLNYKEIQPVHSEWDQPWEFFGRNDAKAETSVLWPPHVKSWLIGKDSDAGRDWGQEEKRMTEGEMAGWHHWLDGRESKLSLGVGDGQGGLECCSSWVCKESDTTEKLNWTCLSMNIWKFTIQVLLKPGLQNFEHYFTSVWDECNCVVVWTFFGIAFLWDWNENWPFPVLWKQLMWLLYSRNVPVERK